MTTDWIKEPFFQVGLPVIITFVVANLYQGKLSENLSKRIDDLRSDMNQRLDEIVKRLERIELKLDDHEKRLTRVEERSGPISLTGR